MNTMAQRIALLRSEKGLSRPALAAALGFPRMAVEKFETGRQTPAQDQQEKLAAYFGVTLSYLRGENNDRQDKDDWMSGAYLAEEVPPAPAPKTAKRAAAPVSGGGEGVMDAFLRSGKFQETLQAAVLEVLRSPEGQKIIASAIRREREK